MARSERGEAWRRKRPGADRKLLLTYEKENRLTVLKTTFQDKIDFVLGTIILSLKFFLPEKGIKTPPIKEQKVIKNY